jgi:diketogulonate reductase-like aldo/keto reductase
MNNIQFQAYSPLGYGEFVSDDEIKVLDNPTIADIGKKHGKHPAAVVLRWHIQRGIATPPFSLYENELRARTITYLHDLDATFSSFVT